MESVPLMETIIALLPMLIMSLVLFIVPFLPIKKNTRRVAILIAFTLWLAVATFTLVGYH